MRGWPRKVTPDCHDSFMPLVEKPIDFRIRVTAPDPSFNPNNLDDLSIHRQNNLLWHLASSHTRAEVAELMPEYSTRSCQVAPHRPARFTSAVLGDDGLHHLWHPDYGMVCNFLEEPFGGPWTHKAIFWWKHEGKPRRRTYTTQVSRYGDETEPEFVPPGEVCWLTRIEGRYHQKDRQYPLMWPEWIGEGKPYQRSRWKFVEILGRGCAVCGGSGVGFMDHDPFTGWVRGMLYGDCNTRIDKCPHLNGCRFADYLNDPPAWKLKADYPGLGNKYQNTLKRLDRALDKWEPSLFREIRRREP